MLDNDHEPLEAGGAAQGVNPADEHVKTHGAKAQQTAGGYSDDVETLLEVTRLRRGQNAPSYTEKTPQNALEITTARACDLAHKTGDIMSPGT